MANTIKIEHNEIQAVVTGGSFRDMLKAVKGSFKKQRAWFRDEDKTWVMPGNVEFDLIQGRIEKKGFQIVASKEDAYAQDRQAKARQAAQRQREREEKWARQREQRAAERAQRQAAQKKAVAERIRVTVGEYQIGDVLNGKPITGFGKSWTITGIGSWGNRGQRWDEPCAHCGRSDLPIDNHTELCERCGADGNEIHVCYAYFS